MDERVTTEILRATQDIPGRIRDSIIFGILDFDPFPTFDLELFLRSTFLHDMTIINLDVVDDGFLRKFPDADSTFNQVSVCKVVNPRLQKMPIEPELYRKFGQSVGDLSSARSRRVFVPVDMKRCSVFTQAFKSFPGAGSL